MARTGIRGSQIKDGAEGVDLTVDVTGTLPTGNLPISTNVTTDGALDTKVATPKAVKTYADSVAPNPVYVQDAPPTSPPTTYAWFETDAGPLGTGLTLWVEDGVAA